MDGQGELSRESSGPSGSQCSHCGSKDVIPKLKLNQGNEMGPFGIAYKALGFLTGTEPLHVDLCPNCGTVTRFFVTKTDRNWSR